MKMPRQGYRQALRLSLLLSESTLASPGMRALIEFKIVIREKCTKAQPAV